MRWGTRARVDGADNKSPKICHGRKSVELSSQSIMIYDISTAHIYVGPSFDPIDTHRVYLGVKHCCHDRVNHQGSEDQGRIEWACVGLGVGEHLTGDPWILWSLRTR